MLNVPEFRAAMVRNGYTQKQLATAIGISEQSLRRKMKSGIFGTDEVEKLIKVLKIADPMKIFFANKVTL